MRLNADGLAVNIHEFGGLKVTPAGLGVSVDNVTMQIGANGMINGNYQVMYPLQRALNEISLQIEEASLQVGPAGLVVNLAEGMGLQKLPTGIGLDLDGDKGILVINNQISALTDMTTITFNAQGALQGNYTRDEDGDISVIGNIIRSNMTFTAPLSKVGNTVSLNLIVESPDLTYANGVLTCNIDAGRGLIKTANIISLAQTELDKLDKVDDAIDAAEQAQNVANNARTVAKNLADKLGGISDVLDTVGDLSKQIGIAVGTSALTSATVTSLAAASLAVSAKSQAQALIASKVRTATGIAGAFAGAFGAIGGAIAGAFGKKGNTINHISNNTYNIGTIKEREDGDTDDEYLYGFTLGSGTDYSMELYPDRAMNPATFMPLLKSGLLPVESVNSRTGMLTVVGGLGVSGNIHGGKDVFANGKKLATEDYVLGRGFLTSSNLTGYATENYVTSRGYITNSSLTSTLGSYVTNSSLTTTLGSYVTNSSLTSTLGSYVTNSSLTSSLAGKANVFTVSSPLTYASNVIGLTLP
ncbi:hypothetical protein HK097_000415 [Rhizophlyctis rosea]|uniref:Uncharacterized protein n=1 Tax=Rhizophlyctis rosea TaxID=64517 RepID=A0AAD5X718_9FUNG|nr:hypothetical protein HK097_000415 [Rhizophlyctis rosea]